MEKGICQLRIIPLRREPSEKSEMVSQLLFGEAYEIAERTEVWMRVTTEFDSYTGWIDNKMFSPVSEEYYHRLSRGGYAVAGQITETILTPEGKSYAVTAGSTLGFPLLDGNIEIDSLHFRLNGQIHAPNPIFQIDVIDIARRFLRSPYLWGGRSPFGYDCSGFTQIIYKISGTRLPRDAWQQSSMGRNINLAEKIARGDLLFFSGDEGQIVHVGLAIPPHQVIHCSGMVRIDTLDEKGIFNGDIKQYTHRLHSVRRII
jgi:gamma-D-glutamyl-L-lysine dipeptidyl-peptidase